MILLLSSGILIFLLIQSKSRLSYTKALISKQIYYLITQGLMAIANLQMVDRIIDRINDISWQAHQGSVAAIIQVLNQRLADSSVRTRAIFDDGVLQLLCEAPTVDRLEQTTLVKQIQDILESIAPRNIRRVHINSRIVREQQLLWLEEINRDSENQLLWSQEIILLQPNIFQQLVKSFTKSQTQTKPNLVKYKASYPSVVTNKNKFQTLSKLGIIGTASLAILLLFAVCAIYALVEGKLKESKSFTLTNTNQTTSQTSPSSTQDPFLQAVRIANQAVVIGQTATTPAQWLDLAAKWQRASELMNDVPPSHSRYQEAKIRIKLYKKYSEAAEEESKKASS